jgi:hypothetical protein
MKLAAGLMLISNGALPRPSAVRIICSVWKMYVFARKPSLVDRRDVILGGVSTSV